MEVGMGIMGWGRGNPYGQPLSISLLLFDPSRWANKSAAAFNLCVPVSVCVCVTAVVLLSGKRMCEHCVGTSGYIMKLTHSHTQALERSLALTLGHINLNGSSFFDAAAAPDDETRTVALKRTSS